MLDRLRRPAPWRLLLLAMLLVVSWLAFAPVSFADGGLPLDKARHLLAFAALAWVAVQGFGHPRKPLTTAAIAAALLAYGVFIEAVQATIPGCHASLADVVADALGIALGVLLARAFSAVR